MDARKESSLRLVSLNPAFAPEVEELNRPEILSSFSEADTVDVTSVGVNGLDSVFLPHVGSETVADSAGDYERESWPGRWDFLMACLGYAVGFGNVWRFPSLAYKNGGGAFLIPFFLCSFLAGIPVFFLEVAMGQYMSEGTITVWRMIPLFKGIGYGTVVIVTFLNIYYIVILAWVFFYLFASFTAVLPWSTCDNEWNTVNCTTGKAVNVSLDWTINVSVLDIPVARNRTMDSSENTTEPYWLNTSTPVKGVDAAAEFWRYDFFELKNCLWTIFPRFCRFFRKFHRKESSTKLGRLSITTDMWTSSAQEAFMIVTVHWISEEWKLHKSILDFVYVQERHTAENISARLMKVFEDFDVADKIFAITTDQGSNIKAACESTGKLLENLRKKRVKRLKGTQQDEVRFRCLAHGIHLAVVEGPRCQDETIAKLRELMIRLKRPRAMEDFRMALQKKDIGISRDVQTRWNSTYKMCQDAVKMKTELDEYLHTSSEFKDQVLNEEEWEVIAAVEELLEKFQRATNDFSASDKPTIHIAIPNLLLLESHLQITAAKGSVPWITKAASVMNVKLQQVIKDWDTDLAIIGRILDPAFELQEIVDLSEKAKARHCLQQLYDKYQCQGSVGRIFPSETATSAKGIGLRDLRLQKAVAAQDSTDEVGDYLVTAVHSDVEILEYWKSRTTVYPTLSCIARDILAMQASAVESERGNSIANNIITFRRNRLSSPAVQASMCLKSWEPLLELYSDCEILE